MSWSGSGQASEHGITVTSLTLSPPYENADEQVREQMEIAADAATKLIRSGAIGGPEGKTFNVSVSGHANPGHEPAGGWANDMVTVSVAQRSEA
jgi:hypothetical protein